MKNANFIYNYELSSRGLEKPQKFKKHADIVAFDILKKQDQHIDFKLHVSPVAKDKQLFKMVMSSNYDGQNVVLKETGKNVHSLLRRMKRKFIKTCRKIKNHKQRRRKRVQSLRNFNFNLENMT